MNKNNIHNLQDFLDYRKVCPFCDSQLRLQCSNSIISGLPGSFFQITILDQKPELVLIYDGISSFGTLINSYLKKITLNTLTNHIKYDKINNPSFNSKDIDSALSTNKIAFTNKCDCIYSYRVTTSSINLTSLQTSSFSPEIFGESFSIDVPETNTSIKITNIYSLNKTKISSFSFKNGDFFNCQFENNIPLVDFDWNDIDGIIKKVKLFLTFS